MESTVTVLWLSTIRLQVLNDLSPVTWVHHAVLIWDQNPHNLTFAINRSVCHALKYQKLFVQNLFSSSPLEVLMEILTNEKLLRNLLQDHSVQNYRAEVGEGAAVKRVITSSRVNCVGCCWLYEWVYYFLCFWLCLTISNTKLRVSFRWWIIKL